VEGYRVRIYRESIALVDAESEEEAIKKAREGGYYHEIPVGCDVEIDGVGG